MAIRSDSFLPHIHRRSRRVGPTAKEQSAKQQFSSISGEASSVYRDDSKTYPSKPPRSPSLAWLNLLGPGLLQVVYGKPTAAGTLL